MSTHAQEQPLLDKPAVVEAQRRPPAVKAVFVLLGCVGLFCIATTTFGGSRPAAIERRGELRAEMRATSLDASLKGKNTQTPTPTTRSSCPYSKKGCKEMAVAKGEQKQATRILPVFEHLVVGDAIKVLGYEVVPSAVPSITFTANESLLEALLANVTLDTLTVGAGCACLQHLRSDSITAKIVNTVWPKSLQFRDASSANFKQMTTSAVSCKGAASLEIGHLDGAALTVSCEDVAGLHIGWVHTEGDANFSASGACNLAVQGGSAKATRVSVADTANTNLGELTADLTHVSTNGVCSFQGQVAKRGEFQATGSSFLETAVKDRGVASCSEMAYVGLHTPAQDITTHKADMCSIDIANA